jgi:hypothetical protein
LGVAGLIGPMTLKALRDRNLAALPLSIRLAGAPLLLFLTLWLYAQEAKAIPYRSLDLVADAARVPGARTVLTVSPDLDIGHPFARSAGLTWVGSTCSQWLSYTAMTRRGTPGASPALRARMDAYMDADLGRVVRDVETRHPDLILLDEAGNSLRQYGRHGNALTHALQAYHPVASRHDVVLLARNRPGDRPPPRP